MVPLDGSENGQSQNGFRQSHKEIGSSKGRRLGPLFELGAAHPELKEANPEEWRHSCRVVVAGEEDEVSWFVSSSRAIHASASANRTS